MSKFDLLAVLGSNTKQENEGVWLPVAGPVEFKLGRVNSKRWEGAYAVRSKQKKSELDSKDPTIEAAAQRWVMSQAAADSIMFGWRTKNLNEQGEHDGTYRDTIPVGGQELAYDRELFLKLIDEHQDIRQVVFGGATNGDHFRVLDEDQKNVSKS